MTRRPTPDTGLARGNRASQDAVRAHPAQHLHREILQKEGQAGDVVAGIHHDQDLRIAVRPLPGRDQPLDEFAHLPSRDSGSVVTRSQT